MSHQRDTQPTFDELVQQVQVLTAKLAAPSARAARAGRLGASTMIAFILALLLGSVALAAIPGAGGVISGCYDSRSGALRVIDAQAGKTCGKSETLLAWNQIGPQGLPGTAGPKGDTGAPGISGYEVVSQVTQFDPSPVKFLTVSCPAGKKAIGGGAYSFPSLADPNWQTAPLMLRETVKSDAGEGWFARAIAIGTYNYDWDLTVTAICANVAP